MCFTKAAACSNICPGPGEHCSCCPVLSSAGRVRDLVPFITFSCQSRTAWRPRGRGDQQLLGEFSELPESQNQAGVAVHLCHVTPVIARQLWSVDQKLNLGFVSSSR